MISRINLICLLMCISLVVVHVLWLVTPTFHEMPLIDYYFYSAIVAMSNKLSVSEIPIR